MTGAVFLIFRTALAFFEIWMCYQFLFAALLEDGRLAEDEKLVKWGNIAAVGLMLGTNRGVLFFSHIAFWISIVVTGMCVIWIVRGDSLLDAELVALYFSFVTLLDFLFAFLSMLFLQQQFEYKVYFGDSLWQLIIFAVSRFIMYGCIMLVRGKISRINIWEYKKFLLAWNVISWGVIRYYHGIFSDMIDGLKEMKGGRVGFSLVILISLIMFIGVLLLKYQMVQKENEFLLSRDEVVEKKYQETAKLVEKNQELVHDIKNHVTVLRSYAEQDECEKIKAYLDKMGQSLYNCGAEAWTGNKTLDMLLNQKKSISGEMNIRFEIESAYCPSLPFDDSQMCALFGNLLDNAVEACERMESGRRWISVKIDRQSQMLFVNISNSIGKQPEKDGSGWVSDKSDKKFHGYGQKSVSRIVRELDGVISYQVQEHVFSVDLSFFDMGNASQIIQ